MIQNTGLAQAISDYLGRYTDEQNLAPKSRKSRRLFMNRVTLFFSAKEFSLNSCRDFLENLRSTNAPSSMNTHTKNLKAFIRFAYEYEYIEKDFSNKLPMPTVPDRKYTFISEASAKEAILKGTEPSRFDNQLARKSKEHVRAGLLFTLYTGLRNSELRKLQVDDFNLYEKVYTVHSKGRKIELANIPMNMIEPLRDWMKNKRPQEKMFEVTEEALRKSLHRGCDKLGLPRQRVHDLRHIFSLTRLRRREPMQLVSRVLRHKKMSTTHLYYSQFLITDLSQTANNSPEIQKQITPEIILDNLEQIMKDYGVTNDSRFRFVRTNGKVSIETI